MMSECLFDDAEVVFVVDGKNEDVGETEAALLDFFFELLLCPACEVQAVCEDFAVGDAEVINTGFVRRGGKRFVGYGGIGCVREDGELTVFFKNGVIDFREGGVPFLPEFGEEFFDIHAVFLQFFLHQFSALYQNGRGSADQTFEQTAFDKKEGDKQFYGEKKDDGCNCMQKGDVMVENGGDSDFGKHDGDDEFGNLYFADLAFTHETHGYDQGEIEDQGSEYDGCHVGSVCGWFGKYVRMCEKEKSLKKWQKHLDKDWQI